MKLSGLYNPDIEKAIHAASNHACIDWKDRVKLDALLGQLQQIGPAVDVDRKAVEANLTAAAPVDRGPIEEAWLKRLGEEDVGVEIVTIKTTEEKWYGKMLSEHRFALTDLVKPEFKASE